MGPGAGAAAAARWARWGRGHPRGAPVPKLVPHDLRRWVGGWVGGWVPDRPAGRCWNWGGQQTGCAAHLGAAAIMQAPTPLRSPPTPAGWLNPSKPRPTRDPALPCPASLCLPPHCFGTTACSGERHSLPRHLHAGLWACTPTNPTSPALQCGWARTAAAASSGGCWGSCTRACGPAGASSATGGCVRCALVLLGGCVRVRCLVSAVRFVCGVCVSQPANTASQLAGGPAAGRAVGTAAADRSAAPCFGLPAAGPASARPACQCCATRSPARCSPRWVAAPAAEVPCTGLHLRSGVQAALARVTALCCCRCVAILLHRCSRHGRTALLTVLDALCWVQGKGQAGAAGGRPGCRTCATVIHFTIRAHHPLPLTFLGKRGVKL